MTAALQDVTEETLAKIAKAQTTGLLETTGLYSYDLTGVVSLIPVFTPFREKIARESSPNGNPFAVWRAIMDVTRSQPRPTPGFDYAANEVIFSEQDFQAKYMPLALAGLITQDSVDVAKGLGRDPYAEGTFQVLNQLLIAEDKIDIGGQSYALPQPGTVTATPSTTGGTVAASTTQKVSVAARTASGYYYGGNSRARDSAAITTTGSTSSIACSIAAVKGAVAYDWFYSSDGTTFFYYTTTTTASVTITSTISSNNAVPSGVAVPDINTTAPTRNTGADNGSGNSTEFDGFLATLTGDYNSSGQYVTAGTATANGAQWIDNAGAALTLTGGSITELNNLFLLLWNAVKCSPTALMMNAYHAQKIANLVLTQPSAVTYLNTDTSGRIDVTAGGRVGHVVNTPAGGVTVPLEVHPALPPGTIIARTDRVPFPQSSISRTLAVRTLRDYAQFDYAASRVANSAGGGPRKEFEIRSVQAFVNRAPVAMGVLTNVG